MAIFGHLLKICPKLTMQDILEHPFDVESFCWLQNKSQLKAMENYEQTKQQQQWNIL